MGDTLCSYGTRARYKDICRLKQVGSYTLYGGTGELSDMQYLNDLLDELDMEDFLHEDGCSMGPKEYASYIGRVMYNRRSKGNPLYNQFVVVGKKLEGPPLLAFVDHQGTFFEEDYIATGFGSYLAMPLLRNEWSPDISLEKATALIKQCLTICFYRDCRAYCKIQIGNCTGSETTISEPITLDHKWDHPAWLEKCLEGPSRGEEGSTW